MRRFKRTDLWRWILAGRVKQIYFLLGLVLRLGLLAVCKVEQRFSLLDSLYTSVEVEALTTSC
jgi:hypothetical protein